MHKEELVKMLCDAGFRESQIVYPDVDEADSDGNTVISSWKPVLTPGFTVSDERVGLRIYIPDNNYNELHVFLLANKRLRVEEHAAKGARPRSLFVKTPPPKKK